MLRLRVFKLIKFPKIAGSINRFLTTDGKKLFWLDPTTLAPNELTGVIKMFGGSILPTGYLFCDGSAKSRVTYAALFGIIGTTFGNGDGSTTFNMPPGGRFFFNKSTSGTGSALGGVFGSIDMIHQVDPPLTISNGPSATKNVVQGITGGLGLAVVTTNVASDVHTHSTDISQLNTSQNNPPGVAVNFIIKT
jgi:microcystin-dependent protein